jgi:biopolymer transport protein ExbB
MDLVVTVVKFFENGGFFMYPILIILAIGTAIAVERYITLTLVTEKNKKGWDKLEPLIMKGDFDRARDVASKDDSTIAQILSQGLSRQGAVRRRDDIELAMEQSLIEIMPELEKRTQYLATFANMATLAGLLGTIIGLIEAFTAVSNADLADKAELLSASISIGMNCTAFGLMVAIPMVLVHALLQSKTTGIVTGIEMASVKFLNSLTDRAVNAKAAALRAGVEEFAAVPHGAVPQHA